LIRLKDDDQDQKDRDVKAEGGLLAVPDGGLPHGEVFAADHHEAGEPEQEGDCGADDGEALGCLEALGGGSEVAEQVVGALGEGERGQGLGGDDGDVGGVPEGRVGDGAGAEGVGGEGRVHAEDVADEFVVGVVIDHVVVGDDEGEGGEGGDEEEFGEAEGHDFPGRDPIKDVGRVDTAGPNWKIRGYVDGKTVTTELTPPLTVSSCRHYVQRSF
jgi:hypothetical protein